MNPRHHRSPRVIATTLVVLAAALAPSVASAQDAAGELDAAVPNPTWIRMATADLTIGQVADDPGYTASSHLRLAVAIQEHMDIVLDWGAAWITETIDWDERERPVEDGFYLANPTVSVEWVYVDPETTARPFGRVGLSIRGGAGVGLPLGILDGTVSLSCVRCNSLLATRGYQKHWMWTRDTLAMVSQFLFRGGMENGFTFGLDGAFGLNIDLTGEYDSPSAALIEWGIDAGGNIGPVTLGARFQGMAAIEPDTGFAEFALVPFAELSLLDMAFVRVAANLDLSLEGSAFDGGPYGVEIMAGGTFH